MASRGVSYTTLLLDMDGLNRDLIILCWFWKTLEQWNMGKET